MAEEKDDFFRPVVHPIDIARIIGCSHEAAEARYYRYMKKLGKGKDQQLTYEEFAMLSDIPERHIIPVLKKFPTVLKIAVAASLLMAFCTYAYFEYDCEYFRTHKMEIEERTPNKIKAHTYQYDPQTKKQEKVTITIERLDNK